FIKSIVFIFFFSSRRRHTRWPRDWSSDVCSSDLLVRIFFTGQAKHVPGFVRSSLLDQPARALGYSKKHRQEKQRGQGGNAKLPRSEERRVGKECRSRWSAYHEKEKDKCRK